MLSYAVISRDTHTDGHTTRQTLSRSASLVRPASSLCAKAWTTWGIPLSVAATPVRRPTLSRRPYKDVGWDYGY